MSAILQESGLFSESTDIIKGPFKAQAFEGTEEKMQACLSKPMDFYSIPLDISKWRV